MKEEFGIGDRVSDGDGERGTVRFTGRVPPTSGEWIGVEWDRKDRGKHDGSHKGHRYFRCLNPDSGPTSGSFARPDKLKKGVGLLESVKSRYGSAAGQDNSGMDSDLLESMRCDMKAPLFQVVGFDKIASAQAQLEKLNYVYVRNEGVAFIEEPEREISALLPSVTNLDLGENLFRSWEQMWKILTALPTVKTLAVSENKLTLPEDSEDEKIFPAVTHLIMGRMGYDWSQIQRLIPHFPGLNNLQIHVNFVREILPSPIMNNLLELDLNLNPLNDWDSVLNIDKIAPALKVLKINDCGLNSIKIPNSDVFPHLTLLEIAHNNFGSWNDYGELNKLKSLSHLKARQNAFPCAPDFNTGVAEAPVAGSSARYLLIAVVANLKILNGTEIERQERYGAELDYLKRYGTEYLKNNKCSTRPRYSDLVDKYGAPEEGELKKVETSIKSSLLKAHIECPDDEKFSPVVKKLPPGMTVQKLRVLLSKIVKKKPHEIDIRYKSQTVEDHEVHLDEDVRDLNYYSFESGDTLLIRY